jgi:hypothetical protein
VPAFDALQLAALAGIGLGFLIAVTAFAVMVTQISNATERIRALGLVFLGMAVVVASMIVYATSLIGQGRLPFWGGIPAMALLLYTAWRLRRVADAQFAQYRTMTSDKRNDTGNTGR